MDGLEGYIFRGELLTNSRRWSQGNAGDFTYITYGTLDEPEKVPPKGEFFCKYRDKWMPEVPGACGGLQQSRR